MTTTVIRSGMSCSRSCAARSRRRCVPPITWRAFGGDEFTIVLPHTDLQGARATADRILERVRKLRLMTPDDGRMVTTSISIGLATFLDSDEGAADLLQRSDDRLYESKHGGKNRVSW